MLAIYALKCVGYDKEFQCTLANAFPTWVPPKKGNSDEDGEWGSEDDKSGDEAIGLQYRPRGTRSRPMI